jgi:hypothetical protein
MFKDLAVAGMGILIMMRKQIVQHRRDPQRPSEEYVS